MTSPRINKGRYFVVVVFFFGLLLLVFLGGWQMNRGLEKRILEDSLASRSSQYTEISAKPETWEKLNHQLVKLNGEWVLDRTLLMDNRVHLGKLGYEVYTPFKLQRDNAILLVNRGWVSNEQARETQEFVNQTSDDRPIKGHLYLPQSGFTLGAAITDQVEWPKVVQYFDPFQLSEAMGTPISTAVLVLDAEHNMSLTQIWEPYVMSANRHFGYAMQWWGLALTLAVFGVIWRKQSFRES